MLDGTFYIHGRTRRNTIRFHEHSPRDREKKSITWVSKKEEDTEGNVEKSVYFSAVTRNISRSKYSYGRDTVYENHYISVVIKYLLILPMFRPSILSGKCAVIDSCSR